uniref:Uncharacterized protein n=1 Tax=Leersia perrieri TaxID=77586 RepID=A0A0D9UX54_9ORYZ
MAILDSPLMGEFIQFLKSNWGTNSRVDQRRRRLRQLVAMVRGVADAAEDRAALRGEAVLDATTDAAAVAGAARKLIAGVKALFVSSTEVERLADAVEELERLAGPGGDLDLFLKVLQLDAAAPAAMEIDNLHTASSWVSSGISPSAILHTAGKKRKQSERSTIIEGDGESGTPVMPPVPQRAASARAVAMAMQRARGRIGNPARPRPPAAGRSLVRQLSEIDLK